MSPAWPALPCRLLYSPCHRAQSKSASRMMTSHWQSSYRWTLWWSVLLAAWGNQLCGNKDKMTQNQSNVVNSQQKVNFKWHETCHALQLGEIDRPWRMIQLFLMTSFLIYLLSTANGGQCQRLKVAGVSHHQAVSNTAFQLVKSIHISICWTIDMDHPPCWQVAPITDCSWY